MDRGRNCWKLAFYCWRGVQLDCPLVRHWDYITTFAIKVRFKIWDQFWIPQGKLHGTWYILRFFVKPQHMLVWVFITPFSAFQGVLGTICALWADFFWMSRNYWTRTTCVNLVCAYIFSIILQESVTYTSGLAMDCRVSLRWHFCCGCQISKPRPILDFPSKNQGSFFQFFLRKVKKWARTTKNDVFGEFSKNSIVLW